MSTNCNFRRHIHDIAFFAARTLNENPVTDWVLAVCKYNYAFSSLDLSLKKGSRFITGNRSGLHISRLQYCWHNSSLNHYVNATAYRFVQDPRLGLSPLLRPASAGRTAVRWAKCAGWIKFHATSSETEVPLTDSVFTARQKHLAMGK